MICVYSCVGKSPEIAVTCGWVTNKKPISSGYRKHAVRFSGLMDTDGSMMKKKFFGHKKVRIVLHGNTEVSAGCK